MRIHINREPNSLLNKVFILSNPAQYQAFFTFKDGKMIATTFTREDMGKADFIKPAFVIEEQELRELIEAFVVAGADRGIDNPTESKIAGKLEATEKHLEDMRKLVFKTNPS